jgi:protocatechuate 4,5-dioxygenase alpha chain
MARLPSALELPTFDLEPPGTYVYSGIASSKGYRLNEFSLSLRRPENRLQFLEDETSYLDRFGLTDAEKRLVATRDWTGLLEAGGHIQAILKLAATVGLNLYDIGAHNSGVDRHTLYESCPRRVSGLDDLDG